MQEMDYNTPTPIRWMRRGLKMGTRKAPI